MYWLLNHLFVRPVEIEEYQRWSEFLRNFGLFSVLEYGIMVILALACFLIFSWAFKVNSPKLIFRLKWLWWLAWGLVSLILQPIVSLSYAGAAFYGTTGGNPNLIMISLIFWAFVIMPVMLIAAFWILTVLLIHPDKVRYAIPFRHLIFKG